jgi:hypothetical protein
MTQCNFSIEIEKFLVRGWKIPLIYTMHVFCVYLARHLDWILPDCKVLFLRGELFVVNGSCAEMKAEHLRNFRKFGVSRWSEMTFLGFSLARPNT